eukprot:SAG11_NODE_1451_length_4880_cov_3.477724_2_plen_297_part_00
MPSAAGSATLFCGENVTLGDEIADIIEIMAGEIEFSHPSGATIVAADGKAGAQRTRVYLSTQHRRQQQQHQQQQASAAAAAAAGAASSSSSSSSSSKQQQAAASSSISDSNNTNNGDGDDDDDATATTTNNNHHVRATNRATERRRRRRHHPGGQRIGRNLEAQQDTRLESLAIDGRLGMRGDLQVRVALAGSFPPRRYGPASLARPYANRRCFRGFALAAAAAQLVFPEWALNPRLKLVCTDRVTFHAARRVRANTEGSHTAVQNHQGSISYRPHHQGSISYRPHHQGSISYRPH